MNKKITDFLELLVVIAIFLVLIQTFLEDFAVIAGWPWKVRSALIVSGFCFDLFFTLEFLIRLYFAAANKNASYYFFKKRGWIDLLASIPLIIFNSGPAVLSLLGAGAVFGMGGMLNVLKVVKAVRIARILRLLRILKVFKQIKHADSHMAQRHVSTIITISVTTFVFSLLVLTIGAKVLSIPGTNNDFQQKHKEAVSLFADYVTSEGKEDTGFLKKYLNHHQDILIIKKGGKTLYSRYDNEYYRRNFGITDYSYIQKGNYGFFFDIRPLNAQQSQMNLFYFIIIVIMVLAFIFYYSPHFALTVSDPIHVMKRGMEEGNYNLEVKIPNNYSDDDIFRLAKSYNERYLPLKDRSKNTEESSSNLDLTMDNVKDLFSEE